MRQNDFSRSLARPRHIAKKAFTALEYFLYVEAASGVILLIAAVIALAWANSPFAGRYHELLESPLTIGLGQSVFSRPVHFWINDGLMTVFFLIVGMEIRREIHAGSLSDFRQATLPLAAAVGGVAVPALVYLAVNHGSGAAHGWAVPTATDIAFAVGVLALLGRSIPGTVRVFLLTLAIVDDIIAVLIIAVFYSAGLDYSGFALVCAGIVAVIIMQRLDINRATAYIVPGAVIWAGLFISGMHPTLAGVILGLMTPVVPSRGHERVLVELSAAAHHVREADVGNTREFDRLEKPMHTLRVAQRDLLPPVVRVQWALHPWVAYGIMPLFALANAGVPLSGVDFASDETVRIVLGVALALVVGKPVGVFVTSWILVRLGLCRLPTGMSWGGVGLVALLAGIGFTMSIFIATLAFPHQGTMDAAKLGVLLGSFVAGCAGLGWGLCCSRPKSAE
ncbi:NhaA family Na+:H+ antiporter [Paraburkholderia bannensis]|uniref:Na(+)/H(+) antiporter NhaA n=1 Tax=Paraburkholderia bannensis TaxID=765414 RepID=A0A7W9WWL4_9BURK|nr:MULTISPECIES: Na+/H+ antiporter NhaA [Paraburkholderia]MBB3261635.1 NhaA family Na+:H+ antiporter [Paraburkholderia sp. WP4_3_2]MBB6106632.1 NhaA family Na+:H+ antiporter [Paraburkholderia bannensis]